MANSPHHRRYKLLLALVSILCILLLSLVLILRRNNTVKACIGGESAFTLLILGDSQMAGAGWQGGYGNCISEVYPNAKVINLAQNGSLLSNGNIYAQWEYYCSKTNIMPDFILLDGGINDLPYLQREEFKDTGLSLVSDALCLLIEQIHETSPDTRILYTLIPPLEEWKESQDGPPAYDIQEHYWKQMSILASSYDYVTVLDLFALNPFHYPCADCYQKYLADSVHFSEAGYRKTFEYINNALVPHLV